MPHRADVIKFLLVDQHWDVKKNITHELALGSLAQSAGAVEYADCPSAEG